MKQMMVLVATIVLGIVICVAILGFRAPIRTMDTSTDSALSSISDQIDAQAAAL